MEQAEVAIKISAGDTPSSQRQSDRAEVDRINRSAPRFNPPQFDYYSNPAGPGPTRDQMMQTKLADQLLDAIRGQKSADAQQRKELEAKQEAMQAIRGTSFGDVAKSFSSQTGIMQPLTNSINKLKDAMENHRATLLNWNKMAAETGQGGASMPVMGKLNSAMGVVGGAFQVVERIYEQYKRIQMLVNQEQALDRSMMRANVALDPFAQMRAEIDFLKTSWRAGMFSSLKESWTGEKAKLLDFAEGFRQSRDRLAMFSPQLAAAAAQDKMAQFSGDYRRALTLGGPMADYQRKLSELTQAKQDLSALKNLEELPEQVKKLNEELKKTR